MIKTDKRMLMSLWFLDTLWFSQGRAYPLDISSHQLPKPLRNTCPEWLTWKAEPGTSERQPPHSFSLKQNSSGKHPMKEVRSFTAPHSVSPWVTKLACSEFHKVKRNRKTELVDPNFWLDGETPALCLRMYPGFLSVDHELGLLPSNWDNFFTLTCWQLSSHLIKMLETQRLTERSPWLTEKLGSLDAPLKIFGVVNTVG